MIEYAKKNLEFYDQTTKIVMIAMESHSLDNVGLCFEHSFQLNCYNAQNRYNAQRVKEITWADYDSA